MKEFKNEIDINIKDKKVKSKKIISYIKELQEINLNELNINEAGEWPFLFKVIFIIFFICALTGVSYGIYFKSKFLQLENAQNLENKIFKELELKIIESSHLYPYEKQVAKMKQDFVDLVNKLPTDIEMSGLLEDINETGIESGLEFKKIEVLDEVKESYYIEVPIEISATGNYHSFGNFVSKVSSLPRIITLHDFRIIPIENRLLQLTIIVKTYKYNPEQIEEGEGNE